MMASRLGWLLVFPLIPLSAHGSWPKPDQLDHRAWAVRDGAPSGVSRFAEARDGTLWLAADSGLYHFDGIHFTLFEPGANEPALPGTAISWVYVSRDDTLYVGFWTSSNVAAIRGEHVQIYGKESGLASGSAVMFREDADGRMWLNAAGKPMYLKGGQWVEQASDHVFPVGVDRFADLFFDSQGTEWVTDGKQLYFLRRGENKFRPWTEPIPNAVAFLQAPDGSLWVARQISEPGKAAVSRFADQRGNAVVGPQLKLDVARYGIFTGDGALWVGNGREGLLQARFLRTEGSSDIAVSEAPALSRFDHSGGLSSNGVNTMFQDRAGNVWVGTDDGIDRFSLPTFTPFTDRTLADEVVISSCPNGDVWFGDTASPLISVHGDASSLHGDNRYLTEIYCDQQNVVWFTDRKGFWQYRDGAFRPLATPIGITGTDIRRLTGASEHRMFVNVRNSGVWLLQDGAWSKILSPTDGFFADHHGDLWHSEDEGVVRVWNNTGDRTIPFDNSSGLGITWVFSESRRWGLVAGGLRGVAILRGEHFHKILALDGTALNGVTGILEGASGDLWLNGARGAVRIPAKEIDEALRTPSYRMYTEVFGGDRGIEGPAAQVKGMPTAVADGYGRLWFSNESRITHVDPNLPLLPAPSPTMKIMGATVDGVPQRAENPTWRFGRNTLRIGYFGVDLTRPQDVLYRYKLEGVDRDWQNAGERTEAVYTSLRPGKYVFKASASNQRNIWKDATPYTFTITPQFYQTRLFLTFCICASFFTLWCTWTARLRYLAARIRERSDERANERVRVARDLHDTLLQGVTALMWRVNTAARAIPEGEKARLLLEDAVSSGERILDEGREKLQQLRGKGELSLADELTNVAKDLNWEGAVAFEVSVKGNPRSLRDEVRDELYWISREAITNAFRHARATQIEVVLRYEAARLLVECRDNGVGFDVAGHQEKPADGHWGICGINERAQRISAKLTWSSRKAEGTKLEVDVPARRAFLTTRWLR